MSTKQMRLTDAEVLLIRMIRAACPDTHALVVERLVSILSLWIRDRDNDKRDPDACWNRLFEVIQPEYPSPKLRSGEPERPITKL